MQKQIALIIIGDEILSGRTQDVNTRVLALELAKIGAALKEMRVVPDEAPHIVSTIRELTRRYDYVFTSGGIGPTHDDITADCVAEAFGVGIDIRDDARAIMVARYPGGEADLTPARLRMARIPDGATLIENPISGAPGFRIENLFTLAGVPAIFKAMLERAITQIESGDLLASRSIIINLPESEIAGPLAAIAASFPKLSFGSYPGMRDGRFFAEIVVRGFDEKAVDEGLARVARLRTH